MHAKEEWSGKRRMVAHMIGRSYSRPGLPASQRAAPPVATTRMMRRIRMQGRRSVQVSCNDPFGCGILVHSALQLVCIHPAAPCQSRTVMTQMLPCDERPANACIFQPSGPLQWQLTAVRGRRQHFSARSTICPDHRNQLDSRIPSRASTEAQPGHSHESRWW